MRPSGARIRTSCRISIARALSTPVRILNQDPFESVLTNTVIPAGITADGKVVLTLAVDHVYWTDSVAQAADNLARLRSDRTERPHEIWMLGTTSARCREELSALGFIVHEDLAATFTIDAT